MTEHKKKETRYEQLTRFVMLVRSLYPNTSTVVGMEVCPGDEKVFPGDLQVLFELLVHSVTVINRLYRLRDTGGSCISQREDYATALELISPLFCIKSLGLPESIRGYYQKIVDEIGFSRGFTWKDLSRITGKSKTRCNNILQHLLSRELVKRAGKGYRDIYLYELLPAEPPGPGTLGQAVEEWEGFRGWEDL